MTRLVLDGTVTVDGSSIGSTSSLRFESPRSFFTIADDELGVTSSITWHAWDCGYPMGLLLDLDSKIDAELRIDAASQTTIGPMYVGHGEAGPPRRISFAPAENVSLSVGMRDLRSGPLEVPLGVLDRRISVALDNEPGPDSVQFEFTDEQVNPGVNLYWIRVLQSDLEMAWSSPIFVDYLEP